MKLINYESIKNKIKERIVEYCYPKNSYEKGLYNAYSSVLNLLDRQPWIVNQFRGHWEKHLLGLFYRCSNCGKFVFFFFNKTNYCSFCGSDMMNKEDSYNSTDYIEK